jgi:hypothetical protein
MTMAANNSSARPRDLRALIDACIARLRQRTTLRGTDLSEQLEIALEGHPAAAWVLSDRAGYGGQSREERLLEVYRSKLNESLSEAYFSHYRDRITEERGGRKRGGRGRGDQQTAERKERNRQIAALVQELRSKGDVKEHEINGVIAVRMELHPRTVANARRESK